MGTIMAVVAVLDIHIDKNAVLIMNPNINLQQRIQYTVQPQYAYSQG